MKIYSCVQLVVIIINLNINKFLCKFLNKEFKYSKFSQEIKPSLLLTTTDSSVSLVYPKELGHKYDYFYEIYKINNNQESIISDSVYDNQTQSIYCLIFSSSSGSDLIRLMPRQQYNDETQFDTTNNQKTIIFDNYQIAPNWSRTQLYKNSNSIPLSINIDLKKRRLFFLENDYTNNDQSILIIKELDNHSDSLKYFLFKNTFGQNTGLVPISIAYDHEDRGENINDIALFVGNITSLNICFLVNMTCDDYFGTWRVNEIQNDNEETEDYSLQNVANHDGKNLTLNYTKSTQIDSSIKKFGQLSGIYYDKTECTLYLSDIVNDEIMKLTFVKTHEDNCDNLKLLKMETILKSNSNKDYINPIESVVINNHIFWADVHEGLKVNVLNSSSVRTIYKVKDLISLDYIQNDPFEF